MAIDRRGVIALANREVERLFGYTRNELVGSSAEVLLAARLRADYATFHADFLANPRARDDAARRDLLGLHKNGSEIPIEIALRPAESSEGVVIASVVDITSWKDCEEELRRSNEELERFAYVASHDLQEPLRSVTSFLNLLQRRYRDELGGDGSEFIDFAVGGVTRMQRLIEDLLAFSRVGKPGAPMVVVQSEDVLETVLQNLRAAIEQSAANITHDALPTVRVDAGQFEQLLTNLIGNALKFRSAVPPRIHVSARRHGRFWLFSIADNGIGIDATHFERIFVIFQRLHTSDEYPGTGLGLAICKKSVERHGGRIWVESAPGQGSTFLFTIPALQEP